MKISSNAIKAFLFGNRYQKFICQFQDFEKENNILKQRKGWASVIRCDSIFDSSLNSTLSQVRDDMPRKTQLWKHFGLKSYNSKTQEGIAQSKEGK